MRTDQPLQIVAHKAGDDPAALHAAMDGAANLIEADVYLFQGRIEVRHARTMGPWWARRWEAEGYRPRLIPTGAPRHQLADIVGLTGPDARLMLDIKGVGFGGGAIARRAPRSRLGPIRALAPTGGAWAYGVGAAVARAWDQLCPGRPLTVSAQAWAALGPFLDDDGRAARAGITVVLSAGTRRQVAAVARRASGIAGAGIGVPAQLLEEPTARRLRACADLLFCWGLVSREQVEQVRAWGVTHVIVDDVSIASGIE